MNDEKLIEFLTELTKLTDKYGFEIGGCGCCGSPWITSNDRDAGDELTYDEEKGCYRVDLDISRDYHEPIYVYGDAEVKVTWRTLSYPEMKNKLIKLFGHKDMSFLDMVSALYWSYIEAKQAGNRE